MILRVTWYSDSNNTAASVKVKAIKSIIFQTFKQLWTLLRDFQYCAAHKQTQAQVDSLKRWTFAFQPGKEYEDSKIGSQGRHKNGFKQTVGKEEKIRYKNTLEQTEKRGLLSMKWADNVTSQHTKCRTKT